MSWGVSVNIPLCTESCLLTVSSALSIVRLSSCVHGVLIISELQKVWIFGSRDTYLKCRFKSSLGSKGLKILSTRATPNNMGSRYQLSGAYDLSHALSEATSHSCETLIHHTFKMPLVKCSSCTIRIRGSTVGWLQMCWMKLLKRPGLTLYMTYNVQIVSLKETITRSHHNCIADSTLHGHESALSLCNSIVHFITLLPEGYHLPVYVWKPVIDYWRRCLRSFLGSILLRWWFYKCLKGDVLI